VCTTCGLQLDIVDNFSLADTGTKEIPKEELKRGTTFADRYEVIEELGRGGMGKVYRVEDTKINEELALKLINPEVASEKKTIQRFINELKVAHRISHRNVCRMFHLGEDKGTYYITMEYVPGEDLKSMIRMTRQLSIGTAVSIVKQVCLGLTEAHRLGVVHRDLKPSNIMIDRDGNARIMDFGIARLYREKGITEAGIMIGTPEYMSPEQVEALDVDLRSDLYSLGVILYEMVTGMLPFKGDTSLITAVKHKTETPQDPRTFNTQIPVELSNIILKCLEKKKDKRYQTAEEVLADLSTLEKDLTTSEQGVPKKKATFFAEKKDGRKKSWRMAAALFVAVLFIGLGIVLLTRKKASIPQERKMLVVLPFENLGLAEDEYFADGITEEITNRLGTLQGLGVISRTSATQYKDSNKTIKQIGEELGADYVLEGSVRWSRGTEYTGRVRVTPQLVRVAGDTQIWSAQYDRVIEDIFSVQYEIAEQVAQNLDLTILEPERQALAKNPTESIEAYDLFMKAREHEDRGWAFLEPDGFDRAIEMLNEAVQIDPEFALAYARMSYIHSRMYFFGIDRTNERMTKSRDSVNTALELQPDLPEAQLSLGFYHYWCLYDYDRAAELFEGVQKVRPNFDPQLFGYILRRQGKWEQCLETLERASRISPRDQQITYEIGGAYVSLHRFAQADLWFNRTLELFPDHLPSLLGKIAIQILSEGNLEKAKEFLPILPQHPLADYMWFTLNMLERNYEGVLLWLAESPYDEHEDQHFYFHTDLAYAMVYHASQNTALMKSHADSARIILEDKVKDQPDDPRYRAALGMVYAYLGQKEAAIEEGELAAKLHPVSKDAGQGPIYLINLAKIFVIVGEFDKALDQLEFLLSIPQAEFLWHLISVPQLQLDPQWDALRENPRFIQLLEINE
ncbi:MAG: protein kinase, partial [Candidatus Aminicenantes bacterium]|nr:protein kinase [Candidatus Aminicenantes bacterium]